MAAVPIDACVELGGALQSQVEYIKSVCPSEDNCTATQKDVELLQQYLDVYANWCGNPDDLFTFDENGVPSPKR
jgi:hypothetical protein